MAHYLVRSRHKTCFYARLVIPLALRSQLGRRELRRSLGTSDLRLARLRAAEFAHRALLTFDSLMSSRKAPQNDFLEFIVKNLVVDHKAGTVTAEHIEVDPNHAQAEVAALKSLFAGVVPQGPLAGCKRTS